MSLPNPYGLSDESMALVQQALDESAPLTDAQVSQCAVLLGLVPVDRAADEPANGA